MAEIDVYMMKMAERGIKMPGATVGKQTVKKTKKKTASKAKKKK